MNFGGDGTAIGKTEGELARVRKKKINKDWTRESGGNQLRPSIIGDVRIISALIEV